MATTTPANAGTISVPMSSVLDALKDKLSEAERTALFEQLIGFRATRVAPGDLITSTLFNQILSDIDALAIRISELEAGTDTRPKKPVITQIFPQLVRTGQEITVIGENLQPGLLNRIEVEETPIPLDRIKPGSGPTRLVLNAPAIIGLPASGSTVIIAISNPAGTGQGSYIQLPAISAQLQATFSANLKSVAPVEEIKPDKAYTYTFELNIRSSHEERFMLVAQIDPGWKAVIEGSNEFEVPSVATSDEFKTTKVITVTTGTGGSATLNLKLKAMNFPSFSASAQPQTVITIAADQDIPTDEIKFVEMRVLGTTNRIFQDNTLFVKRVPSSGSPGKITLTVVTEFTIADDYQVGALSASPGWTVALPPGSSGSIETNSAKERSPISIDITPTSSGNEYTAADGELTFSVASKNSPLKQTFRADLRVVTALPPRRSKSSF